jgi:hypothetical protein
MPPIKQMLEAAKKAYRLAHDRYMAQFSDAPMSSADQQKALAELNEHQRTIKRLEMEYAKELELQWGPTTETERIQEIMDRYPSTVGVQEHPTGHIGINKDGSAREIRSPGGFNPDYPSQQMDMFPEEKLREQQGLRDEIEQRIFEEEMINDPKNWD